jgi:DNA-binding response OmpR family regulator
MPNPCDELLACCPCLVLAHGDGAFAQAAAQALRRGGWDVYPARSGPEARRLARMIGPDLVVLDADLPGESGWLTCAKLAGELPLVPVLLVGDGADAHGRRLAAFAGATDLVDRNAGMANLLREVDMAAVSAVR